MVRRKTVKKNASKRKTNKKNASKRKTNKKNASKRKTNRRKSNKKMVGGGFEINEEVYVKIIKETEKDNFWVKGTIKKATEDSYEVEVIGHSVPSTGDDPNITSVNSIDIINKQAFDGIKTDELAIDNIILGNITGKGEWYKGKITTTNTDSTVNISYDNGTTEENIGIDRIKYYADVVKAAAAGASGDSVVKTDAEEKVNNEAVFDGATAADGATSVTTDGDDNVATSAGTNTDKSASSVAPSNIGPIIFKCTPEKKVPINP